MVSRTPSSKNWTDSMAVRLRRQMSVALPNEPGALARICEVIAEKGINIDALTVIDNIDQGMVRFLADEADLCRSILEQADFFVMEAQVLEMDLPNRIGMLREVSARLAGHGINLDYAYGTQGASSDQMRLILRVSDNDFAGKLLGELASHLERAGS